MTSCTCPCRAWAAAMASSASMRSRRVSPMPTKIPVVNGIASEPAYSRVARRRSGVLSGEPRWQSRSAVERLEHHALRRRDRPQLRQFVGEQRARVGVGEQAGLVEHQLRHRHEIVDGGRVAVLGQPGLRRGVAQLGPLAQREQRLVAAGAGSGRRDRDDLFRREIRGLYVRRRLGERAVAAFVAAQHGERDEDLGRIGDAIAETRVTNRTRLSHEVVERPLQQLARRRRCSRQIGHADLLVVFMIVALVAFGECTAPGPGRLLIARGATASLHSGHVNVCSRGVPQRSCTSTTGD